MPTLTTVNPNLLASVTEDALVGPAPAPTRVGFNYANFLTSANESSDTDGFLLMGNGSGATAVGGSGAVNAGKLFVNTGTTLSPVYKELVQGVYDPLTLSNPLVTTINGDFNTNGISSNAITIRLTGVFVGNAKVSGSDSKLYWEPNLPANLNGIQPAFYIRAADNANSIWNDGNDTVSAFNSGPAAQGVLVSINVLAVNDAPVFTVGADITVAEDAGAQGPTLVATGIGPGGGPDEAAQVVTMSLMNNTNPGLFAAIAIDAAGNLTFTPTANASGTAVITVKAMDNGGTGNGGSDTTTHTFNITVTPVNDAPVNGVPGAAQGAVAQHVVFSTGNGNALSVTDVDAGSGNISVTLSLTNAGTMHLTAAGAAIVTNNDTGSVQVTGTLADVNASLQGADAHTPTDSLLTMVTNDNGNTGAGGALTDTDFVTIGVAPAVTSVDEPAPGTYSLAQGSVLNYIVHFDGAVNVTGTPRIVIAVDAGGPVYANYSGGGGTADLTFTYTVGGAENDPTGISAGSPIDLNGGTITSTISATAASLVLVGLDPTPAVLVDNTPPTVPAALDLAAADDSAGASNSDDVTNITTGLTISGTGENGSTVSLFEDVDNSGTFNGGDVALGSSLVAAGVWSVDASLANSATAHHVRAYATDTALNVSAASAVLDITVDTVAPATPGALDLAAADDSNINTDNYTSVNNLLTISGTGENGSTVTLFEDVDSSGTLNGGDVTVGNVVVAGGVWTLDTGAVADGVHHYRAQAVDVAGNMSGVSGVLDITVDTQANPPTGLDLTAATDSGVSNTDNITNDSTPDITGLGDPGATVTLSSSMDGVVGSTVVAGNGTWTITTNVLSENVHSLTATQADLAGNVSGASVALGVTIDLTPPAAPSDPDLAAADDTGASNSDNITKNTTGLTFSGTAEAGSTVTLFNDAGDDGAYNVGVDTILGTGVAAAGNWSFDSSVLAQGTYVIRAFATDVAGNVGAASATATTLQVVVDTTAPAAPTIDLNAADDSGVSNSDNITNHTSALTIDILSDPNSTVSIFVTGGLQGTVVTNGAGVASFDLPPAGTFSDGTYAVTASVVDTAGNQSPTSAALNITIDTVGPAVTYNNSVYDVSNHTLTISGSGFAGLGAADVTALVQANAADLTWDVDGGGADYTLAAADVASAMVPEDHSLVLVLNTTANIMALEADPNFGSPGAATLNPIDSIAIAATFVGTDVAGNAGTGFTLAMDVLGTLNEGAMPHSYSADLTAMNGATDDTMGVDGVNADLTPAGSTLWISGESAARVSVVSFGGGDYVLLDTAANGSGTGNGMFISGANMATNVSFADGSKILDNTGGVSDTLNGTRHDDQLIASSNGDRLLGNAGNDLLIGGNGSDAIYGGSGNDVIFGGGGNDYLSGGSGMDTFIFSSWADGEGYDVISDFQAGAGGDVIDSVSAAGGAAAVLATAIQSGADTLIVLNASETIRLLGVTATNLTLANFSTDNAYLKGSWVD